MSDEDDELAAMGARKLSKRALVWAVVTGAIVALVLVLTSYYAAERDRARSEDSVQAH